MKKTEESSIRTSLRTITTNSRSKILKDLESELKKSKKRFIITANPETIMLAEKDSQIKDMLDNEDILKVPDGIAVVKACKKIKMSVKERITGCDLSVDLLEFANKHKKNLYLFGSKPEVIEKMAEVVKEKYPKIKLLKAQDGYVKDRDKVRKDIIKQKPDLCLVALGIPHQEKFINSIMDSVDKGIYMGVGGTFDVLSGSKKRAPKLFIKLNLEWLYRIMCEPSRLKRFYDSNIKFMLDVYFKK